MATRAAALGNIEARRRRSRWSVSAIWYIVRRQPFGAVGCCIIMGLVAAALLASYVAPHHPSVSVGTPLVGPGDDGFILGTDHLGRDVLSRILYGARVSLQVSILAVLIGTVGGAAVGVPSAYFGGKTDLIVQRCVDAVQAFPALILLIALVSVIGASTNNAIFAIGGLLIATQSRVIRSAVLAIRSEAYIEAARSMGASDVRIMLRHVLPNVFAPIVVLASLMLGNAILIEAGLSFLGLGTQPPTPSWGQMLSVEGRTYMFIQPWLAVYPGIAIVLTVLSFNLIGDSLRDVLDPRLRHG